METPCFSGEKASQNTPTKRGHSGNSPPSPLPPRTPLQPAARMTTPDTPRGHYGNKGACFTCKEEGHWARDCPNSKSRSSSRNAPRRSTNYPEKKCKCGLTCLVRTSRTAKNPNRDFYCCPKSSGEQCNHFNGWCDMTTNLGQPDPSSQYPICNCRAGKCRLLTVQDGELAGCQYFVCMLKEGHGACSFFEWYLSPSNIEPENDREGEVEGPKSPTIVGREKNEESAHEVVVPAATAARREDETKSAGSMPLLLNWRTADDDTSSDETFIPGSPPPPTRRKLDFDEATSGFVAIDVPGGFEPSLSFKDCLGEVAVIQASSSVDSQRSQMNMHSPHVSLNLD